MGLVEHSSPTEACADCGSIRLTWRVKRMHVTSQRASKVTLVWTCRDCGAAREEALALEDGLDSAGPGHRSEADSVIGRAQEDPERTDHPLAAVA